MGKYTYGGAAKEELNEPNKPDDLDPNKKFITGPYNVVRMEGFIGSIKKVIYLFFDVHRHVMAQTECTNIYSQYVHKYFANSFRQMNKGNKKYDLFVELRPSDIDYLKNSQNSSGQKNIFYIGQVARLVSKILQHDEKTDKVSISEQLKNIRVHYIDIRDYFENNIFKLFDNALYTSRQMMMQFGADPNMLQKLIDLLVNGGKLLEKTIHAIINENPTIIKKTIIRKDLVQNFDYEFNPETITQISTKITGKYNHPEVQKIIKKLFTELIETDANQLMARVDSTIKQFMEYHNIFKIGNVLMKNTRTRKFDYGIPLDQLNWIVTSIVNECMYIVDDVVNFFANFMDLYFLRRILDKDYITNSIVYTGGSHSINYIQILSKYFDFKITHAAYNLTPDIDTLNKEIKLRVDKNEPIDDLLWPPQDDIQCSDLSNFPENFE